MKKIIIRIIFGLFIIGSLGYCRGHWSKSPEDKAKWVVKKISSELDLTDTQKAELEKMKVEYLQKRKDFGFGIDATMRTELISQIKSEKLDEPKLNKMVADKIKRQELMIQFFKNKFVEFHNLLTSEQKITLAEKTEKFMKKFANEIE